MAGNGLPDVRRRVRTRHGLDRETEARLAELGRKLPPSSEEAAGIMAIDRAAWLRRRLVAGLVVVVVAAVLAGGLVQWFRPLPQPTLKGLARSVRIRGTAPTLPWPAIGEAAIGVPSLGTLGEVRDARPVPIGVLAGVLTAYVVLGGHPLSTGGTGGPTIAVTAQALAAYRAGSAAGEPEVPVFFGESLTELDALAGLLVESGSDMATLLAVWDAGSTSAFVKKMDRDAFSLGLRHTRVTAPGGATAVVSTPSDLIRLAEAAMRIRAFRQIVSLGEVTLPESGLRYNPNFSLGENGVIGIEAGSDVAGNGCYLFAAQKDLSGRSVTLYGAVLGQSGPIGPTAAAVDAGDALTKAAFSDLDVVTILQAGRVVGELSEPWSASVPVMVSHAVTVPAWPGLRVSVTGRLARLTAPIAAGTRVGWLQIDVGTRLDEVALQTGAALRAPSALWRLAR